MNQNVSPEQASADLVTLETKPSEEGSGAPTQASQPDPTDSGLHEVCVTPSSYVRVSLNDPGLQRRHTHAALVTGSVMRTYYIIDSTGAEIDVEESLNRPPQEIPALEPNAMLPEDDVALSERDQYEYPASDGSESTVAVGTPQSKHSSQDNTSSGSSAATDTPVVVVSSRYSLKVSKMSQMIRKGKTIALKSQEMKMKGKHNPKLHFKLKSHASSSSAECIALHTVLDVPSNYNHILDTAKFNISVTMSDHSASNTPLPLPQPQHEEFTLVQENKHMIFQLLPHSFVLDSRRLSIDLVIEVQLIYYVQPEESVTDYEEKNPTNSLPFVDIHKRTESLPKMNVIASKTVSVTNEEQTIEWKERGLTLHVPKNSLPAGCHQTKVTIVIAHSDSSNRAQDTQCKRYISYEVKCIDGEEPKRLTLEICRDTTDAPQSQGSVLSTVRESPHSGSTDVDSTEHNQST